MTTTELINALRQQVTNQAVWGGNREIVLLMNEAADRLEELDERVAIMGEDWEGGWVPVRAIHQVVEHNMDMQDTYLPIHFLDLIDSMPTRDLNSNQHQLTVDDILRGGSQDA